MTYFEIYEDALKNDYGTGTWNNRNQFIETIIDLGSRDEETFKAVKRRFETWIKKYNEKFLYYQLQKLELEYYSRVSQKITIGEVIERLSS